MTSIPIPSSGTVLDRPGMSFGAPGWNAPAMHRLKAANAQQASKAAVTKLTSIRSFDEVDLYTPSQQAAGNWTDRIMMTTESNIGLGAIAVLLKPYIHTVCIVCCQPT